jgi:hypothetical protein
MGRQSLNAVAGKKIRIIIDSTLELIDSLLTLVKILTSFESNVGYSPKY